MVAGLLSSLALGDPELDASAFTLFAGVRTESAKRKCWPPSADLSPSIRRAVE